MIAQTPELRHSPCGRKGAVGDHFSARHLIVDDQLLPIQDNVHESSRNYVAVFHHFSWMGSILWKLVSSGFVLSKYELERIETTGCLEQQFL